MYDTTVMQQPLPGGMMLKISLVERRFSIDNILARIYFNLARLQSPYAKWETGPLGWIREHFAWLMEGGYLVLRKTSEATTINGNGGFSMKAVVGGCHPERKTLNKKLHFEELTGVALPVGSIHIRRLVGPDLPHLLVVLDGICVFAGKHGQKKVYAVLRAGIYRFLREKAGGADFITVIPSKKFAKGHVGFLAVEVDVERARLAAPKVLEMVAWPTEGCEPVLQGNAVKLRRALGDDA